MDGGDLDHRDRGFGVGRFLRIPDINYITDREEWTKRFQQYFLLIESCVLRLSTREKISVPERRFRSSEMIQD